MQGLSLVDLDALPIDRFETVIGADEAAHVEVAMRRTAERLDGRTVWMINSTAEGGGVAEMLSSLLPYCLGVGWDVRWAVISGSEPFFDLTKSIHNALHGAAVDDITFDEESRRLYCEVADENVSALTRHVKRGDIVVVHDPQPAGMIAPLLELGSRVVWHCHVGTDTPDASTRSAWDFLRPSVERAERYVFTRAAFLWEGLEPQHLRVIAPAIEALAPKNALMDGRERDSVLAAAGVLDAPVSTSTLGIRSRVERFGGEERIPADARIVLEVSRWDRLKDPIGFIQIVEHLEDRPDVHLVFAGPATNGVDDDPEGASVLEGAHEVWRSLAPHVQRRVHLLSIPMENVDENAVIVNALQRRADVIVQKSIEEGFGLTVAEAMWKTKPVVASRVGGIQDQIEHGSNGILVDDPRDIEGFADAVRSLLDDPDRGRRLGEAAHNTVHDRYLGHCLLTGYAGLIDELI
jgi:trehalose synthase